MTDRKQEVAAKALKILEMMPTEDSVATLRQVSSPTASRSDLKYAYKLLQMIDDDRLDEAESKLEMLASWHEQCVGG
ncbi:MAG: hypothetical protein HY619_04385 [Thaumarchaeota archaeon]|nr:hypothetical protein [Nitrososphaerota archaeon]